MNWRALKFLAASVAAVSSLAVATPSFALLVQPVLLDMRATGMRANGGLKVVNDRNQPVTVEITVQNLIIPERGETTQSENPGDDFLIFPATTTIPAGGAQIFRVRWVGDPDLAKSQSYMLTTSELPISFETESKSALQVLYAIQSVVLVGPTNGKTDISVAQATRGEKDSKPGVYVWFKNDGALHGFVSQATVRLKCAAWSAQIDPGEVASAVGLGVIPAAQTRAIFLPVADVPQGCDLSATADIPARN